MLESSHIVWNLLLAFIPVVLATAIAILCWRVPKVGRRWWVWGPLGLLWLGFLPNTAYLITEWRHFIEYMVQNPPDVRNAVHDHDALMSFLALATFYVVYSGAGLLAFSMSIWPIAQLTRPNWLTRAIFFYLCALGVYLGLIQRLNTWDIIYHSKKVMRASTDTLAHPMLLLLTIGFAAVLWLNYWVFEVFVEGLGHRIRRMKCDGEPARPA